MGARTRLRGGRCVVNLALSRVQQLLDPPSTLFAPAVLRRVAVATRRGGRAAAHSAGR